MKTTILALSLLAASSSAMASIKGYDFVALDTSEATKLCVVSAKEGFDAAKKMSETGISNVKCNGKRINNFAKQFQTSTVSATKYSVVPVNSNVESKICAKAASEGFSSLNVSRNELRRITCNGRSVKSFARAYFNQ